MPKSKDAGEKPSRPPEPDAPAASGRFRVTPRAASSTSVAPAPTQEQEVVTSARSTRTLPPAEAAAARKASRPRTATACLESALKAKTPALRVKHARAGLVGICDIDTQGLLLRQLYLGELEGGHFVRARQVAEQLVELGVMPDVARHDAARACQALGALDAAIEHLRAAADASPPARLGFHLSTLGAVLYLRGRAAEAEEVLERALGCEDAVVALLHGQIALARHARGDDSDLDASFHALKTDRASEGYGRFVLGELAFARGDRRSAQIYLSAFLAKVKRSRPASQAGLAPEVDRATHTLGRITLN